MSGYTTAVAMVAAAGFSAYTSIESGRKQQAAADAQAQAEVNQAAYQADAAKAQAEKIRKAARAQQGEANASLAASGVKLGDGSALEIQKTITQNAESDVMAALLSGKRITSAADEQAALLRQQGANAQRQGYLAAAGTVLGAGATAYSGWKK